MGTILLYAIFTALAAAFMLTVLRKWGVIEWVQVHGNNFFAKMFSCNFCLAFWAAVFIAAICVLCTGNWALLFCPVITPIITTKMI